MGITYNNENVFSHGGEEIWKHEGLNEMNEISDGLFEGVRV